MVKVLIGVVAAVVVAAGGFFGFEFYVQHRVEGQVDAAFEQIRAAGNKASHGKVSYDVWNRNFAVADIVAETASQPPVTLKIGSVTASGIRQVDTARFAADTFEIGDLEVGASMAAQADMQITYKVPKIIMKDYSGPASLQRQPASAGVLDIYRFALEQFAVVSASSITAPGMTGTLAVGKVMSGDFTYSGLALRDIANGKIATIGVERVAFTVDTKQAGKAEKMTGEMLDLASRDFDTAAAAAILDPQKANDDKYYRAYGLTTAGAYTITSAQGGRMRIEGLTIDDVALRPSRMQLPALLAMMPPPGAAPPTPAQARDLMEKVAGIYEGIRIGKTEMRGLSFQTPQGSFKLSTIRFNLENGKIGEFAFEGLDSPSPKGPVKIGRFALKALDLAGLLRATAQFANPAQKPSADQFLALLPLLEGVELRDFAAPFKDTGKTVDIATFNLNWGQFVGPIPSRLRLTAKMTTPLDAADPGQRMLIESGLGTAAIDADLGAAWTESSGSFALDPVALEVGGMLKASARFALTNVPRQVFSLNPQQAAAMAGQIEAGPLELTVRDTGGVDMLVAEYAHTHGVSRDDARQAIIQNIRDSSAATVTGDPDAQNAVDALARFIETPRTELTFKLTPRAKVPAMQLLQLLKTDPGTALSQFRIEASTAL
jgi:hypothetical protein